MMWSRVSVLLGFILMGVFSPLAWAVDQQNLNFPQNEKVAKNIPKSMKGQKASFETKKHRVPVSQKNVSGSRSNPSSFNVPKSVVESRKSTPMRYQPIRIVLDPGHGGKDPGAIGVVGTQEKKIVLAIAKIVLKLLNQDTHYRVWLTRTSDVYLPLRQRLAVARRYKPDLFVSIHADAAYKNSAVGASVFALSERGATSEMARWLAKKENESELVDGVFVQKDRVLRSVLLDLSQSHAIRVSLSVGKSILRQLSNVTHLHYARVEQAAFVVLKSPDIPSLLVETGYLTNAKQEQQLRNPHYQRQIAQAIVSGIRQYFSGAGKASVHRF